MSTRIYGYLYDKSRTVKDDAASIRRAIKTLTQAGMLPADWRYSVRFRRASMCQSIDVRATAPRPIFAADPFSREPVRNPETGESVFAWQDRLTREAASVLAAIQDLLDAHNHDGSDLGADYWDVKFYGAVQLDVEPGAPRYVDPSEPRGICYHADEHCGATESNPCRRRPSAGDAR